MQNQGTDQTTNGDYRSRNWRKRWLQISWLRQKTQGTDQQASGDLSLVFSSIPWFVPGIRALGCRSVMDADLYLAFSKITEIRSLIRKFRFRWSVPCIFFDSLICAQFQTSDAQRSGFLRRPSKAFESLRKPSKAFESLRKPSKAFGSLRKPSKAFEILRKPSKSFGILRNPSKSFENHSEKPSSEELNFED